MTKEAVQVQFFPQEDVDQLVRSVVSQGKLICLLGSNQKELVGVILPQSDLSIAVDTIERKRVEELAKPQNVDCSGSFKFEPKDASEAYFCHSGAGIQCLRIKKKKEQKY